MTTKTEEYVTRVADRVAKTKRFTFPGDGSFLKQLMAALMEMFGNCQQSPTGVRQSIRQGGRFAEARATIAFRRQLPWGLKRHAGDVVEAAKAEAADTADNDLEAVVMECQSDQFWGDPE